MKLSSVMNRILGALVTLSFAIAGVAYGQGITTSALTGFVNDMQGKPVSGASVTVVHEPSGTRATAVTRANGQYDFSGLRVGGPYTVTANNETRKDVFLDLGQTAEVNFPLAPE